MIKPIVEGHGEVAALPILLRRIASECFGVWNPPLLNPGRYAATQLIRQSASGWIPGPVFAKAAGHARNEGASALLVLLDADDFCVKQASEDINSRLFDATGFSASKIVFAAREYEAWLLASAETLVPGVAPYAGDPEGPRNAKGALRAHLNLAYPYSETTDQPRFSTKIDLSLAYNRSRSFQKLTKEVRNLLVACGCEPAEWPAASIS